MKKYRCIVCEWIYDPAVGDPDGGIAPGTSFEDIPDDWVCPVCGVGKDQFEEVEEKILKTGKVRDASHGCVSRRIRRRQKAGKAVVQFAENYYFCLPCILRGTIQIYITMKKILFLMAVAAMTWGGVTP